MRLRDLQPAEGDVGECNERLISEYIDGDLPPVQARQLEHHLWVCTHCRVVFLELRAIVAATKQLPVHGTTEG